MRSMIPLMMSAHLLLLLLTVTTSGVFGNVPYSARLLEPRRPSDVDTVWPAPVSSYLNMDNFGDNQVNNNRGKKYSLDVRELEDILDGQRGYKLDDSRVNFATDSLVNAVQTSLQQVKQMDNELQLAGYLRSMVEMGRSMVRRTCQLAPKLMSTLERKSLSDVMDKEYVEKIVDQLLNDTMESVPSQNDCNDARLDEAASRAIQFSVEQEPLSSQIMSLLGNALAGVAAELSVNQVHDLWPMDRKPSTTTTSTTTSKPASTNGDNQDQTTSKPFDLGEAIVHDHHERVQEAIGVGLASALSELSPMMAPESFNVVTTLTQELHSAIENSMHSYVNTNGTEAGKYIGRSNNGDDDSSTESEGAVRGLFDINRVSFNAGRRWAEQRAKQQREKKSNRDDVKGRPQMTPQLIERMDLSILYLTAWSPEHVVKVTSQLLARTNGSRELGSLLWERIKGEMIKSFVRGIDKYFSPYFELAHDPNASGNDKFSNDYDYNQYFNDDPIIPYPAPGTSLPSPISPMKRRKKRQSSDKSNDNNNKDKDKDNEAQNSAEDMLRMLGPQEVDDPGTIAGCLVTGTRWRHLLDRSRAYLDILDKVHDSMVRQMRQQVYERSLEGHEHNKRIVRHFYALCIPSVERGMRDARHIVHNDSPLTPTMASYADIMTTTGEARLFGHKNAASVEHLLAPQVRPLDGLERMRAPWSSALVFGFHVGARVGFATRQLRDRLPAQLMPSQLLNNGDSDAIEPIADVDMALEAMSSSSSSSSFDDQAQSKAAILDFNVPNPMFAGVVRVSDPQLKQQERQIVNLLAKYHVHRDVAKRVFVLMSQEGIKLAMRAGTRVGLVTLKRQACAIGNAMGATIGSTQGGVVGRMAMSRALLQMPTFGEPTKSTSGSKPARQTLDKKIQNQDQDLFFRVSEVPADVARTALEREAIQRLALRVADGAARKAGASIGQLIGRRACVAAAEATYRRMVVARGEFGNYKHLYDELVAGSTVGYDMGMKAGDMASANLVLSSAKLRSLRPDESVDNLELPLQEPVIDSSLYATGLVRDWEDSMAFLQNGNAQSTQSNITHGIDDIRIPQSTLNEAENLRPNQQKATFELTSGSPLSLSMSDRRKFLVSDDDPIVAKRENSKTTTAKSKTNRQNKDKDNRAPEKISLELQVTGAGTVFNDNYFLVLNGTAQTNAVMRGYIFADLRPKQQNPLGGQDQKNDTAKSTPKPRPKSTTTVKDASGGGGGGVKKTTTTRRSRRKTTAKPKP